MPWETTTMPVSRHANRPTGDQTMMTPARMSTMLRDLDRRVKALEALNNVRPGGEIRSPERPQAEVAQEKIRAEAEERMAAKKAPSVSAEPPPAPEAPPSSSSAVEAPAGMSSSGGGDG